jgi:hypothetical protein
VRTFGWGASLETTVAKIETFKTKPPKNLLGQHVQDEIGGVVVYHHVFHPEKTRLPNEKNTTGKFQTHYTHTPSIVRVARITGRRIAQLGRRHHHKPVNSGLQLLLADTVFTCSKERKPLKLKPGTAPLLPRCRG